MAGKKGHLWSLIHLYGTLHGVSCSVVCLSPGISTTAQAATLSVQTNSQEEKHLLPSAWILSEM